MGLGLHITQMVLVYILFSFSGFSMYRLIKFLHEKGYSSKFSIIAFSGAILYMFNFYVLSFLLFDFFESWFIYAFLPLAIIVFLKGMKNYILKQNYFKYIFYLVLLVEIMSVGFWEPPYLLWTLFLFLVLTIDYFFKHFNLHENMLALFKYILIVLLIIIVTNIWWIYSFILETTELVSIITPSGNAGFSTAYRILASSYLYYPSHPFSHFLNVVAFYPIVTPYSSYNGYFLWAPVYLNYSLFFIGISFVFMIAVFANIFEKKAYRKEIIHHKPLFYSLLFLIYFALQGLNPSNRVIIEFLLMIHFKYVNILYSTNMQFIGFPIIFLYSLSFSKTIAFIKRKSLNHDLNKRMYKKSIKFKKIVNRKNINIVIFTLIIVVGVVYPWYMWTPKALPVFTTTNGKYISPVVNFPNYFYNMTDYINKNAHNAITLILPEYANFFTMNFNNSSYADTLYAGLITGTPAISNYYSNLTIDIENMMYNYPWYANSFANFLNTINVKYILLNTVPVFLPGNPGYNISYLKIFLSSQPHIKLAYKTGPLILYENMMYSGIISIGNAIHYSTNMNNSQNAISIFDAFSNLSYLSKYAQFSYNFTNSSLILRSSLSSINPIYFTNARPLNINLGQYHYLLVKVKTSSNVQFIVGGNTYYSDGLYGHTFLERMNLSSYHISSPININKGLYYNSTENSTIIYPLYGQYIMPYAKVFNSNNVSYNLSHSFFNLGLSFIKQVNNESGWIQIYNISLVKYVSIRDIPFYLASSTNSSNNIIVPSRYNTSNSNIKNMGIQYKELNPARYVIKIFNATGPFILYLKQSFDSEWALYLNGKLLSDSYHFVANIYNNGWYINKSGNYTIEIVYAPQQLYNYIELISLTSFFIIFIGFVTIDYYMNYKKKRKTKPIT